MNKFALGIHIYPSKIQAEKSYVTLIVRIYYIATTANSKYQVGMQTKKSVLWDPEFTLRDHYRTSRDQIFKRWRVNLLTNLI